MLPPEPDLMKEENASRSAVRLALDLLRAEGLVERLPGVGTTVVGDTQYFSPLGPDMGIDELLDGGPERVRVDNHTAMATTASPGVANRLEIPVGAEVAFLERVLFLDDRPLTLRSSWIPATLAGPVIEGKIDLRHSICQVLEEGIGLELGVSEYSIEATLADEAVASIMSVPVGSPLLLMECLTRLPDGRPAEYGYARSRPDRIRFVTSVHRRNHRYQTTTAQSDYRRTPA
jgi:GntR family transcriptional regulator